MKELNYLKKLDFKDLDLFQVGNSIRLTGVIYSDKDQHYLCHLPDTFDDLNYCILDMNLEEWKKFIRQTDLMETEVIAQGSDQKLVKIILRKSNRVIDSKVSWKVFERDGYCCRYCGKTGVPLTVDHLVLWEDGGPTIEENLLTSCRKCNKQRGNMKYEDWLESDLYKKKSQNVHPEIRMENALILSTLKNIPRVYHKKSR